MISPDYKLIIKYLRHITRFFYSLQAIKIQSNHSPRYHVTTWRVYHSRPNPFGEIFTACDFAGPSVCTVKLRLCSRLMTRAWLQRRTTRRYIKRYIYKLKCYGTEWAFDWHTCNISVVFRQAQISFNGIAHLMEVWPWFKLQFPLVQWVNVPLAHGLFRIRSCRFKQGPSC